MWYTLQMPDAGIPRISTGTSRQSSHGVSSGNVFIGQSTPTCFSLWALTEGIRNLEGKHWSHLSHESTSPRKMGWGLGRGWWGRKRVLKTELFWMNYLLRKKILFFKKFVYPKYSPPIIRVQTWCVAKVTS